MVRDPWHRLISGYADKYMRACNKSRECFHRAFAFGVRTSPADKEVTFDEFAKSLLKLDPIYINAHFRPIVGYDASLIGIIDAYYCIIGYSV